MKMNQTRYLTYNALLAAIIIVLTLIPMLGFIQVGPAAIQIVSIPVIIGAILFGGRSGIFLSIIFGLGSVYAAVTRGATPIDLLFVNPLVAIGPRLLFGLSISPLYKLFKKTIKTEPVAVGVTAFVSSIIHSVATLTTIAIALGFQDFNVGLGFFTGTVLTTVILVNVLVEAVASVFVTVPVVAAVKRVIH